MGKLFPTATRHAPLSASTLPVAHNLDFGNAQVIRARQLHPYVSSVRATGSDAGGGSRRPRLMTGPDAGACLQRGGRITRREWRIRNEYPVVAQTVAAAIGPVPEHYTADSCGGT